MFMRTYASSRVKRKSFLLRDSENDLYKQVVWDENNWLWFVGYPRMLADYWMQNQSKSSLIDHDLRSQI